jgi:hypothetical protein
MFRFRPLLAGPSWLLPTPAAASASASRLSLFVFQDLPAGKELALVFEVAEVNPCFESSFSFDGLSTFAAGNFGVYSGSSAKRFSKFTSESTLQETLWN